jgi:anti-sigma B factor antagonist
MNREEPVPPPEPSGRRPSDGCSVRAPGELDTASAGRLLADVAQLVSRCREVVVDLSAVTFVDGAGVDALLAARRAVEAAGGSFRLSSPRPSVRYVLALTGTEDAFDVIS